MPLQCVVVGMTDVGKTRKRNEDSLSVVPELGVAVVADGMGGHPGGDVASRIAATTASEALRRRRWRGRRRESTPSLHDLMHRSVLEAHAAIRAEGER